MFLYDFSVPHTVINTCMCIQFMTNVELKTTNTHKNRANFIFSGVRTIGYNVKTNELESYLTQFPEINFTCYYRSK